MLFSAAIFLITTEVLVRVVNPQPSYQIVRDGSRGIHLYEIDGEPVWHPRDPERRWRRDCPEKHPSAKKILVFGSSIFYGAGEGIGAKEIWSFHLQELLDASLGPGRTCVMNFAQPGFSAQGKLAVARAEIPRYRDAIVVLEAWNNDPYDYTLLGGAAYSLRDIQRDVAGYPDSFNLPKSINGMLFRYSEAYAYASLSLARPDLSHQSSQDKWRTRVLPRLDELRLLVQAQGSSLRIYPAPSLDRPFDDSIGSSEYAEIRAWAEAQQVAFVDIAELLSGEDHLALRIDPCCHYNRRGHRVLAERMLADLMPSLRPRDE